VVTPTGRLYSGGDIAVPIARELPLGAGTARVIERFAAPTRWGYGRLAANRSRLGRFVSGGRRRRAGAIIAGHRERVRRTVSG
jgi:predicted DCC family thiol-disulfide oxidoreductase YuxK